MTTEHVDQITYTVDVRIPRRLTSVADGGAWDEMVLAIKAGLFHIAHDNVPEDWMSDAQVEVLAHDTATHDDDQLLEAGNA